MLCGNMRKNYECKKIKIGKFYLWYYVSKPYGINCMGIGDFSISSYLQKILWKKKLHCTKNNMPCGKKKKKK